MSEVRLLREQSYENGLLNFLRKVSPLATLDNTREGWKTAPTFSWKNHDTATDDQNPKVMAITLFALRIS